MKPIVSTALAFSLCLLAGLAASADTDGLAIAKKHTLASEAPPRGVPTDKMVDGPILGNGDVGVVLAGQPDRLKFYIGKNDFWSVRLGSPINVGRVEIRCPELAGGTWHTDQDMAQAEVRGAFGKDAAKLATQSFVDANRNLLVTELANAGTVPLHLDISVHRGQERGAGAAVPAAVADSARPAAVGREEHSPAGRWFFDGEIAGLKVVPEALAAPAIAQAAATPPAAGDPFDPKTVLQAPAVAKAVSVTAWIKIRTASPDANYILSKGSWDNAYSLGLSNGCLRFTINGCLLQTKEALPKDRWLHVAGSFDGQSLKIFVDGKLAASLGSTDAGDGDFRYAPSEEPDGKTPWRYGHLEGPILAPLPPEGAPEVAVATRLVETAATAVKPIILEPGKSVVVATVILSNFNARNPQAEAKAQSEALTATAIAQAAKAHRAWWAGYWNRSFIEIADQAIERAWVAGNYGMGSCSRPGKIAPGLWGNWITMDQPAWRGDFHLNYNFQAPFYGVYANNHPELAEPFYQALTESLPEARKMAKRWKQQGILFPVSIGPWGWRPWGTEMTLGQKSNAAYAAMLFIWGWQYSQDTEWLKTTGYPFLRDTAEFWENYLKLEDGPDGKPRYVIHADAIHEGSGDNVNPILSLGLVRTLFKNLVPMSEALGVDAGKRAKWQEIAEKMSEFPLQEKNGRTVFRYSEKGTAWWGDNTLGIQHIFPAEAINLESDPKLLETCHNMIAAMGRWEDGNGSSSWYTALARTGYDPKTTLERLHQCIVRHSMPNGLMAFGGGGIENYAAPMMVTEFLLQSENGVLRLFPGWSKGAGDARFGTLRAKGAFLVSAELKAGVVAGVKITSEKGRDCTIQNPWPGKKLQVVRNGKKKETVEGERFTLKTKPGESIELKAE
jgi:hypothetical protein